MPMRTNAFAPCGFGSRGRSTCWAPSPCRSRSMLEPMQPRKLSWSEPPAFQRRRFRDDRDGRPRSDLDRATGLVARRARGGASSRPGNELRSAGGGLGAHSRRHADRRRPRGRARLRRPRTWGGTGSGLMAWARRARRDPRGNSRVSGAGGIVPVAGTVVRTRHVGAGDTSGSRSRPPERDVSRRCPLDQSGQVTVLIVGMGLVLLSVAGLAIDGTRAFLERRALQNLADGAALAAADQLDRRAFYVGGGEEVRLQAGSARLVAIDWLERSSRPVRAEVTIDDPTVQVSVRSEVRTQFLRLIGVDVLGVEVMSHARPDAGSVP
ncbi:MAG: hypothetical protein GEU78_09075 [Actinobacteria bacterium]|nr:hypothetical protein [Actinomycetota bacterium]